MKISMEPDGTVRCPCGFEFDGGKFFAHLKFFGWVCCRMRGREFREGERRTA